MLSFSLQQYLLLAISLLLIFFSLILFFKGKERYSIALLLIGAFGIRLFIITVDPFLHDWDERFHALVAKNMMSHPFKPMLYVNPVMPYDYKAWCCNHIWVHKQPLFLWQIALSMKAFGVDEFTLRLPSAIMGSIQVYFIYRIGKLLFDSTAGFFGSLFFAMAYYPMQLIAGVGDMDHIRVAFGFYVCASVWAFAEYDSSGKKIWAILVGIFSGCAVLNMWLPGLVVYGAWSISIFHRTDFNLYKFFNKGKKELLIMICSLAVAAIIFLPWQIYISHSFPVESAFESTWNLRHITEPLEQHDGPWYYYLAQLPMQFGIVFTLLIPVGMYFLFSHARNQSLLAALLFTLLIPYAFFSLFVQTRMPSYVYMSHFIIWLSFGMVISGVLKLTNRNFPFKAVATSLIIFLISLFFVFKINDVLSDDLLRSNVGDIKTYRERKINNTGIYKKLNFIVPPNTIVFNCNTFETVEAMFWSDRTVYAWYTTPAQHDSLKQAGIKMAAFMSHNEYQLPDYITNDTAVLIIEEFLQ